MWSVFHEFMTSELVWGFQLGTAVVKFDRVAPHINSQVQLKSRFSGTTFYFPFRRRRTKNAVDPSQYVSPTIDRFLPLD
jgi:YHS domain-containing protein